MRKTTRALKNENVSWDFFFGLQSKNISEELKLSNGAQKSKILFFFCYIVHRTSHIIFYKQKDKWCVVNIFANVNSGGPLTVDYRPSIASHSQKHFLLIHKIEEQPLCKNIGGSQYHCVIRVSNDGAEPTK